MDSKRTIPTVADSIRDATAQAMRGDDSVILFGLGVNDPGRVFGTTSGLVEEFGIERVFETPTAENAMMGIAVGAALGGFRPIITHQRADFFYLAMDQLVNSAAKWRFMFGGQFKVPLVVRLIVGRGWGQGPTHSQNLATWLSHVPGLKVVYPSNSSNAGSLLLEAIADDNPIVYIEDRWLHTQQSRGARNGELQIGKPLIRRSGKDVTVVTYGLMVSEALKASEILDGSGVRIELIDLGTLTPMDSEVVEKSLRKTRRLLFVEAAPSNSSFGAGTVGALAAKFRGSPKLLSVDLLGMPHVPVPTSFGATAQFYPRSNEIASRIFEMLGIPHRIPSDSSAEHDVNGTGFSGPF